MDTTQVFMADVLGDLKHVRTNTLQEVQALKERKISEYLKTLCAKDFGLLSSSIIMNESSGHCTVAITMYQANARSVGALYNNARDLNPIIRELSANLRNMKKHATTPETHARKLEAIAESLQVNTGAFTSTVITDKANGSNIIAVSIVLNKTYYTMTYDRPDHLMGVLQDLMSAKNSLMNQ